MRIPTVKCPICMGDGEFPYGDDGDFVICDCCEGDGYAPQEQIDKWQKDNSCEHLLGTALFGWGLDLLFLQLHTSNSGSCEIEQTNAILTFL
jgi:hypothetical protein